MSGSEYVKIFGSNKNMMQNPPPNYYGFEGQQNRPKRNESMPQMVKFSESPAKRLNKIIDELQEEDLGENPEEESGRVNKVPSFKYRFNFSERKGQKLHPDDFNILKGYNCAVRSKSQRISYKPILFNSNQVEVKKD